MSFDVNFRAKTIDEAEEKLESESLPRSVKSFISTAIAEMVLGDNQEVKVRAFGHLHNGQPGDNTTSSATIDVGPVVAEQSAEQTKAGDTVPLPEAARITDEVIPAADAAAKAQG